MCFKAHQKPGPSIHMGLNSTGGTGQGSFSSSNRRWRHREIHLVKKGILDGSGPQKPFLSNIPG